MADKGIFPACSATLALCKLPAPAMLVPAVVRDSFLGTLVYALSGRRVFRHPEELPNFVLPAKYDSSNPDSTLR